MPLRAGTKSFSCLLTAARAASQIGIQLFIGATWSGNSMTSPLRNVAWPITVGPRVNLYRAIAHHSFRVDAVGLRRAKSARRFIERHPVPTGRIVKSGLE